MTQSAIDRRSSHRHLRRSSSAARGKLLLQTTACAERAYFTAPSRPCEPSHLCQARAHAIRCGITCHVHHNAPEETTMATAQTSSASVNNGVNVDALIAAREALT